MIDRSSLAHVADSLIHNKYMGSDHCPIELKFELDPDPEAEKKKPEPVATKQVVDEQDDAD